MQNMPKKMYVNPFVRQAVLPSWPQTPTDHWMVSPGSTCPTFVLSSEMMISPGYPSKKSCTNDWVTRSLEVASLGEDAPNSDKVQRMFNTHWVAWYPRSGEIGIDNGKPFMKLFIELCKNMGMKQKPITPNNPQGNSII